MKKYAFLMLVLSVISEQVFAGPFANYANRPGEVESVKSVVPRNILCGIHKKWEGDYLCVDGVWLTTSQFENKFRIKVKKIEELGVLVTGGKILVGFPVLAGPTQMEKR